MFFFPIKTGIIMIGTVSEILYFISPGPAIIHSWIKFLFLDFLVTISCFCD
jgi:hypothetical protein